MRDAWPRFVPEVPERWPADQHDGHERATSQGGGLCARDATVFPQAIGLAATWDPALVEAVASVIREQMLATGARQTLAPVLDVARDPRWGRVE